MFLEACVHEFVLTRVSNETRNGRFAGVKRADLIRH